MAAWKNAVAARTSQSGECCSPTIKLTILPSSGAESALGDGLQSGRGLTMAPGPVRDENLAEEVRLGTCGLWGYKHSTGWSLGETARLSVTYGYSVGAP